MKNIRISLCIAAAAALVFGTGCGASEDSPKSSITSLSSVAASQSGGSVTEEETTTVPAVSAAIEESFSDTETVTTESRTETEIETETSVSTESVSESSETEPSETTASLPEVSGDGYLTLVNKTHMLPGGFFDEMSLVSMQNYEGETFWVEEETLAHFRELQDDMTSAGIDCEIISAYRSIASQQEIWDDYEQKYGHWYCEQYVAVPGYSEHHTGLAIDARLIRNGEVLYYMADGTTNGAGDYAEFHSRLAEHGFILRYLNGKDSITGYSYEPWHIRYVGAENAKRISASGLTLEEYLGEADIAA